MEPAAAKVCQALAEVYFTSRYPGFDLSEPDWPTLREHLAEVSALHAAVASRLTPRDDA